MPTLDQREARRTASGRARSSALPVLTPPTTCSGCSRTTSRRSPRASGEALLLTAKARVIAPLRVLRRAADDFLLLTEPELGDRVRVELVRMRFAAKAEIEPRALVDTRLRRAPAGDPQRRLRPGGLGGARRRRRAASRSPTTSSSVCASRPARPLRREIDDRVLPAEAGLTERAVSFTKGCYPGQEPIARQHYRGKLNRRLRVLELEGEVDPDAEIRARREGRRARDERRTRASRSPTFASRCPMTPCSRSTAPDAATLTASRARSSGDRALPCGGRGRKFESCRAHRARNRRRKSLRLSHVLRL